MTSFETASTYNPRGANGSAYELMGAHPGMQAAANNPWQQSVSQIPFAGPPQQAWQSIPWANPQQTFFQPQTFLQPQPFLQSQPYVQPFIQGLTQQSLLGQGLPGAQPFLFPALGYHAPWQTQFPAMPHQTPYAGYGPQAVPPVVTIRSAEVNIKLPLHRLIGRHPQEVHQYLLHAVVPVLVEGAVKRSLHPEPGRTLSSDLRGECIAEIAI